MKRFFASLIIALVAWSYLHFLAVNIFGFDRITTMIEFIAARPDNLAEVLNKLAV